jgi:thiol-disulfide isomerase/thioredoxin
MARTHLVLLIFVVGIAGAAWAQSSEEVPIGGTLRDATLRGLNGPPRKLSEFFGKPLIINVWASWCGPCRAEMASLERLAWRDEPHVTIIGISTDDYEERALAVLTSSNATVTHFIDGNLLMEKMLGASRLPLTVLVAPDGRILDKIYGAREWDGPAALAHIERVFRGRSDDAPAR